LSARILYTFQVDASSALSALDQIASAQQKIQQSTGAASTNVTSMTGTMKDNKATITSASIQTQTYADVGSKLAGIMQQIGNVGRSSIGVYTALAVWNIRQFQYTQQLIVAKFRLAQVERDLLIVDNKTTQVSLQQAAAIQALNQSVLSSTSGFNGLRIATGTAITAIGRYGANSIEAENATVAWNEQMLKWANNAVAVGAPTAKVQEVMKLLQDSITSGQIPAWDKLGQQVQWNTEAWGPLGTAGMTAGQVLASGSKQITSSMQNQVTASQTANNALMDYNATLSTAQSALKETQMKLNQANSEMVAQGANIAFAVTGTVGSVAKIYKDIKEFDWKPIGEKIAALFAKTAASSATAAVDVSGSFVSMAGAAGSTIPPMTTGVVGLTGSMDGMGLAADETGMSMNVMNGFTVGAVPGVAALSLAEDEAALSTDALASSSMLATVQQTLAAGATAVWTGAMAALDAVMDANPIVLIILAIIALVAILVIAYEKWKPFHDAVDAVAKVLSGALMSALTTVYNGLKWVWDNVLAPIAKFIGNVLLAAWLLLANGLKMYYNIFIKPVFDALKFIWVNLLAPVAKFIGNVLLGAWNLFATGVKKFYDIFLKPVFDALAKVYNAVLKPIGDFLGGIGKALSGVGHAIGGAVTSAGDNINKANTALEAYNKTQEQTLMGTPVPETVEGTRATGGVIPVQGNYEMHPGEVVTPAPIAATGRLVEPAVQAIQQTASMAPTPPQIKSIGSDSANKILAALLEVGHFIVGSLGKIQSQIDLAISKMMPTMPAAAPTMAENVAAPAVNVVQAAPVIKSVAPSLPGTLQKTFDSILTAGNTLVGYVQKILAQITLPGTAPAPPAPTVTTSTVQVVQTPATPLPPAAVTPAPPTVSETQGVVDSLLSVGQSILVTLKNIQTQLLSSVSKVTPLPPAVSEKIVAPAAQVIQEAAPTPTVTIPKPVALSSPVLEKGLDALLAVGQTIVNAIQKVQAYLEGSFSALTPKAPATPVVTAPTIKVNPPPVPTMPMPTPHTLPNDMDKFVSGITGNDALLRVAQQILAKMTPPTLPTPALPPTTPAPTVVVNTPAVPTPTVQTIKTPAAPTVPAAATPAAPVVSENLQSGMSSLAAVGQTIVRVLQNIQSQLSSYLTKSPAPTPAAIEKVVAPAVNVVNTQPTPVVTTTPQPAETSGPLQVALNALLAVQQVIVGVAQRILSRMAEPFSVTSSATPAAPVVQVAAPAPVIEVPLPAAAAPTSNSLSQTFLSSLQKIWVDLLAVQQLILKTAQQILSKIPLPTVTPMAPTTVAAQVTIPAIKVVQAPTTPAPITTAVSPQNGETQKALLALGQEMFLNQQKLVMVAQKVQQQLTPATAVPVAPTSIKVIQPELTRPAASPTPKPTPAETKEASVTYAINGPVTIQVQEIQNPEDIKSAFNKMRRQMQFEKTRVIG